MDEIFCSYCGEVAVLIRSVGDKKFKRKEYLCNGCIEKEMNGELKQKWETVDNLG